MNGCIPLFINLKKCPKETLTMFPKKKVYDIYNDYSWILSQFFPTKIYKKKFLSIKKFLLYFNNIFKEKLDAEAFVKKYPEILEVKKQLINYTKEELTTENVAKNIISTTTNYLK